MEAKSKDDVHDEFLASVRELCVYWSKVPADSDIRRCEGVAFSILTLIDGCSSMPAMDLVVRPHPEDKQYNQDNGDDWYQDGMVFNDDCMLHDSFYINPLIEGEKG